ncbi:phage shock protein C (PspC) family protein [Sediminitomix flava]|uniref:Phage shock protein C (PspC) family protein n=2 Tax=Sediminitomix flava TaxID=379075 RepID=A0A315Z824_SEDFL|nr:phage shock protein C (PspC) family protein [Sediminitomix flava]
MYTTTIHIGGIIFHFEEKAAKRYKENKSKIDEYFLNFANGQEVLLELDNRVGEILLSMLFVDKQYLTEEDVIELFQKLGDYKEILGDEIVEEEEVSANNDSKVNEFSSSFEKGNGSKKFYRDTSRKLLAGVAAGVGHYFQVDPVWVRVGFVLFLLNVAPIDWLFSGIFHPTLLAVSAYAVAWFILPENSELKWNKDQKRFFRHPNDQIIGGVAAGLASYFSIDPILVRVAFFALSFYNGVGIFLYLMMFVITPEANSLNEQIQMKGKKVKLDAIYERLNTLITSLKLDSLDINEKLKSSSVVLQNTFYSVKSHFQKTRKFQYVLGRAVQIFLGTILLLTSVAVSVSTIFICFVILDLIPVSLVIHQLLEFEELFLMITNLDISLWDTFRDTFSLPIVLAILFVFWWPAFMIGVLGLRLLIGRNIYRKVFWTSVLVSWSATLVFTVAIGLNVLYFFRQNGYFKEEVKYIKTNQVELGFNRIAYNPFTKVKFHIIPTQNSQVEVVYKYGSFGSSRREAITNAKEIEYSEISEIKNKLIFDSHFQILEGNPYRGQRMEVFIYMPHKQEFSISEDLAIQLSDVFPYEEVSGGKTWEFDHYGHIQEVHKSSFVFSHPIISQEELDEIKRDVSRAINITSKDILQITEEAIREARRAEKLEKVAKEKRRRAAGIGLKNFNRVNTSINLDLELIQSDDYLVKMSDDLFKHIDIKVQRNTLEINPLPTFYSQDSHGKKIRIFLPALKEIRSAGFGNVEVKGFSEEEMDIAMKGMGDLNFNSEVSDLTLIMNGSGSVTMKGKSEEFSLSLTGNCNLDGERFEVENINATVLGNCSVALDVKENAIIYKSDNGKIKFIKEPEKIVEIKANEL